MTSKEVFDLALLPLDPCCDQDHYTLEGSIDDRLEGVGVCRSGSAGDCLEREGYGLGDISPVDGCLF